MKIFSFFILFFLFNTLHIDSNSTKRLIYDINDLYDNKYNVIYFVDTDSNELREILNDLNIEVLSYIIDDKKYYVRNIEELEEIYLKNKNLEEKILYQINGFKIDGISTVCTNEKLIELDKLLEIY